ncbi:McrC family protein [Micromonospora sp. LOL_021]|uniref:McrC family protein n=1 Tax=Micromonospora sp. LOL_021 TaxID=3345417 RepID=UPI003A8A67E0
MIRAIQLREAGPALNVALTGEQARQLAAARAGRQPVVEVRPGPSAGRWLLRATRLVGAARIGDLDVYVAPKVPVARLLFLFGYARNPHRWQPASLPLGASDELAPALAEALCRQVDRAIRGGLRHGYQEVDAASTVLRGRMLPARQLTRRLGQPLPLEVRYDEFTADTPENRILVSAVERMLRVPGLVPSVRRRLSQLAERFPGVARLRPGAPVPIWRPGRSNAQLHTALWLAELVLAGSSLDARVGDRAANGLLLDMARVFESFVAAALRAVLPAGQLRTQTAGHLDEAGLIDIRPDLTWWDEGRVAAVADTKYKTRTPVDDLYQMLAYCVAYGLDTGHLIYAGEGGPTAHVVRRTGIRLVCHRIDLDGSTGDLLEQVRRVGAGMTLGRRPGRGSIESAA